MKVLVLTDNKFLLEKFIDIIHEQELILNHSFDFYYTFNNQNPDDLTAKCKYIRPLNINENSDYVIKNYDLLISLHCKQIFPPIIIRNKICINVHPGYNPFNRGWYPHVFSIINKMPIGATIHLMDEQIDHGPIIDRKLVEIDSYDDSESLYNKILKAEVELIKDNLKNILNENITVFNPEHDGNYNSKKDYENLCKIDLNEKLTFREAIDRLRALTHGNYNNAYFIDDYNNKIFVKILLSKSNE